MGVFITRTCLHDEAEKTVLSIYRINNFKLSIQLNLFGNEYQCQV